jgi:hypothetical protein
VFTEIRRAEQRARADMGKRTVADFFDSPDERLYRPTPAKRIVCTTAEPAATAGNTGNARPNTEKPRRQEGQRGRIRMESSTSMLAECSKPARASLVIDQFSFG